jgi:hypothetical protein
VFTNVFSLLNSHEATPMKLRLLLLCPLLTIAILVAREVSAQGVYLCNLPNGTREYRNTGDTRGCRKLDLESLSTIPSPAPPPSATQAKASTDPSFPRIESQLQKRRDQDRVQILLEEMRLEESKLSELKREFQNGEPERLGSERNYAKYQERVAMMKEAMIRTEKNIEALRREISQLK